MKEVKAVVVAVTYKHVNTRRIFVGINRQVADLLSLATVQGYTYFCVRFLRKVESVHSVVVAKHHYDDGVLFEMRSVSTECFMRHWSNFYVWVPKVGNAGILCNR